MNALLPSTHRTTTQQAWRVLFTALLVLPLLWLPPTAAASTVPTLGLPGNIAEVKRYPGEHQEEQADATLAKRISARSAIILDASRDLTLFAKNPDDPRQPASTIKVLTGSIAIRSLTGSEDVPVSREAASRPSSKVYLSPEQQYRAWELIHAVLLASANDASVAIAELLAGTESEFTEIMNLQAEVWGATNTTCKTATGLTAEGQASTARDLANIFRGAMQHEEFAAIMKKRSLQTAEGKTFYNHNKALWQIEGTLGGKTGYTLAARQTYVGKFARNNQEIIVAILGSETMWYDLKLLVQYGFQQGQYLPPVEEVPADNPDELAATGTTTSASSSL